jgi:hypothetical protein
MEKNIKNKNKNKIDLNITKVIILLTNIPAIDNFLHPTNFMSNTINQFVLKQLQLKFTSTTSFQ